MRGGNGLPKHPIAKFRSPNGQSDQSLIKAVAAADQAAMRTLYLRHNANEAPPQTDEVYQLAGVV
jgi:hypothetical protein